MPLVDAVVDGLLHLPGGDDIAGACLETRFSVLHQAAAVVAATGRAEEMTRLVVYLTRRLDLSPAAVTAAVCDTISPYSGDH